MGRRPRVDFSAHKLTGMCARSQELYKDGRACTAGHNAGQDSGDHNDRYALLLHSDPSLVSRR